MSTLKQSEDIGPWQCAILVVQVVFTLIDCPRNKSFGKGAKPTSGTMNKNQALASITVSPPVTHPNCRVLA
eukprot:121726-Amphidinium_carterae.1